MSYGLGSYGSTPYAATAGVVVASDELISDGLACSDGLTAAEVMAVRSAAILGADLLTVSKLFATASDTVRITESLRLLFEALLADTLLVDALLSGDPLVTTAVVDALVLSGVATSSVAALALLSDTLALQDLLRSVVIEQLEDSAAVVSALEALVRAMESVVSSAAFSEDAAARAVMTVLVPDVFDLGADPTAVALRLAGIEDGLDFAVSFSFENEPYYALSMNAANRGVAEYRNFDFNSIANFGGELYAAGDAGLYRLAGEDDAGVPIAAYIRTAMQRLSQGNASRVSDAYLGFRGNGQLQLKVVVKDRTDGAQKGYVFDLIQSPAGAPLPGRFKLGKGLQSVYMAFELGNVAGADFAVDILEIRPLVSYRKLP